jgi:hypothetical protein
MTENKQEEPCFMCNELTSEVKKYSRIVNVKPFPLCKRCQEWIKQ